MRRHVKVKRKELFLTCKNKRAVEGALKFQGDKNAQKGSKKESKKENAVSEKKAKWRRDHNELVSAIKMSRLI